jgi:PST family polysaccharide transporter
MILWVIPHIAWSVHGTVISLRDVLLAASRPLLSGIAAAILAFTVQFFCSHWSPFPRLILGGVALLSVYVAMLLFVMGQKAVYLSLMRSMWKRSPIDENAPA